MSASKGVPSAFHQAHLVLMKIEMELRRREAESQQAQYHRLITEHELQMIELSESRRDPDSERQAEELMRRMRGC